MAKKHSANFKEEQLAKKKAEKQEQLDELMQTVSNNVIQETLIDSFQRTSFFLQDYLETKLNKEEMEALMEEYANVFYYIKTYQYVIKNKKTGKFVASYAFDMNSDPNKPPVLNEKSVKYCDKAEDADAKHIFKSMANFFIGDRKDEFEIVELDPIIQEVGEDTKE